MQKLAIFLSYLYKCKPQHLFFMLHKPEALRNWLAEKVEFDTKTRVYTFHWADFSEKACITELDEKHYILEWEWIDTVERGAHLRFQVAVCEEDEDMTELIIEDFCEKEDEENYRNRWDKLAERLGRNL